MSNDNRSTTTVLIVGATGYIGRAVVAEAVRQGHDVIAVTRSPKNDRAFDGAEVVVADVADPASIAKIFTRKVDVVISCLATRSGLPKDFDTIAIFYNADMLATAGIDPAIMKDWTWNAQDGGTFTETVAKLTLDKNGKNGKKKEKKQKKEKKPKKEKQPKKPKKELKLNILFLMVILMKTL